MLHMHALGAILAYTAMQWIMDSSARPGVIEAIHHHMNLV